MTRLRILTLNIWNRQGPWRKRLALIRRELEALQPDIVGLQEVMSDGGETSQAHELAKGLGFHVAYGGASRTGGGGYFGNAVLARYPLAAVNNVPLPGEAGEEARAVFHAAVDAPCGHVPFFVTHLDWKAAHGHVRVRQVAAVLDAVNRLAPADGFPAIVVGDFNAAPETDEVRCVCEGRSGSGARLPFVDCFAAAGDGTDGHTFARSNRYAAKGSDRSQRIDYVFSRGLDPAGVGAPLVARVVCTTPQGGAFASDHYGVYVELRAAPERSSAS